MEAVIKLLRTIVNAIGTLGDLGLWLAEGVLRVGDMMTQAIAAFGTIMRIFPHAFATAVVGVCGGLIVLRILGRS